uniref:Uncharacterized protein n=1 Tax=Setaria viridis TaxID=4556 RepID=A0A4U6TDP8_SETVI|nr:hypothetical protein SEVIR_8G096150v2 [Setaria viridis]
MESFLTHRTLMCEFSSFRTACCSNNFKVVLVYCYRNRLHPQHINSEFIY